MTDDLIGRAEAQTAIQFAARRYTVTHEAHGEGQVVWSDNLINVTDAMNVLRDLPSAQPERKTGHWVEIGDEPYDEWECDVCGFTIDGSGCIDPEEYRDVYNFCPRCGSDMRGEENGQK